MFTESFAGGRTISKRRSRHKAKAKSRSKPRPQSLFTDTSAMNDLSTWYDEIKEVPDLGRLARRGKILLNIVRNTDILIRRQVALKTDRPTKALFNSVLGKPHSGWDFPRMKITQSEKPLSKTSKLTSPGINFLPLLDLHLAAEALFGHDRRRWNIAHENLKVIGEGALELQMHTKLLEQWRQDKRFQEELGPTIDPDGRLTHEPPGLPPEDLKDLLKHGKILKKISDLMERLHTDLGEVICLANRVYIPVSISPRYACSDVTVELEVLSDLEIDLSTYKVIFPTTAGYVFVPIEDAWDNNISVKVPSDATHGCVFLYSSTEDARVQSCVGRQKRIMETVFEALSEVGVQYAPEVAVADEILIRQAWFNPFVSVPECNPRGFFEGIYPSVENFRVDGIPARVPARPPWVGWDTNTIDVFSTVESVFTFRFFATRWLHIRIVTDDGVLVVEEKIENPPESYSFTPPSSCEGKILHVTLDVTNECVPLSVQVAPGWWEIPGLPPPPSPAYYPDTEVFLRVRPRPNLSIAAIEATQGIQQMESLSMHAENNPEFILYGRTTVIRFFIDSGLSRGENPAPGDGLNDIMIEGELHLFATDPYEELTLLSRGSALAANFSRIRDSPTEVDRIREGTEFSLNFQIPGSWVKKLHESTNFFPPKLSLRIGRFPEGWREYWDHVNFEFPFSIDPRSYTCPGKIHLLIYNDPLHNLTVGGNLAEIHALIEDSLLRYLPIRDDGVSFAEYAWGMDLPEGWDLTTILGWVRLLNYLEARRDDLSLPANDVLLALLPDTTGSGIDYARGGLAISEGAPGTGWWFNGGVAAAQFRPATIAHEYIHLLGINHSPCHEAGGPDPCDPLHGGCDDVFNQDLPDGRTEEVGMDVYSVTPRQRGVGDLMSYCDGEDRWTSRVLWNYLQERLHRINGG